MKRKAAARPPSGRGIQDGYLREIAILEDRIPADRPHPFDLPLIKTLGAWRLHPRVTFLIGENGSGKSTLLEGVAVAWGFNPEGGSKNFRFGTTDKATSPLHDALYLTRGSRRAWDGFFFRAESYFNLATNIDALDHEADLEMSATAPIINSYGGRSLHEQSHGESFFSLFMHRFRGDALYILDEPEAALSPMRQMALLSRMHDLVGAGAQFLIATHSPILMAYPDAEIHMITPGGLRTIAYAEAEHVRITRDFLNRTEKMLDILLDRKRPD